MRDLFFSSTVLRAVAAAAVLAGTVSLSRAGSPEGDPDASCRIPFETLKDPKTGDVFPVSAALNDNADLPEPLRQRYIVADLNSTDANGYCRGVVEHFTPVGDLSEFPLLRAIAAERGVEVAALANESAEALLARGAASESAAALGIELENLKNYVQQVQRFKTEPLNKPGVFHGYCVGQTLSLCEIVDGRPKLIYRFVTSSSKWSPPLYRYYAPINFVKSRNWGSDRRYTPADARRDARMGGGTARPVPFANDGEPIEMPNFLHFLPMPGYTGETGNGIHQIAGGTDSGGTFGAPVSLGCLRLGRFQSKLARWWTPTNAKFFVHFEPNRYRKFGVASTGKARGFQAPVARIETAAADATNAPAQTRPKRSARAVKSDAPFGFSFGSIFSN
jgi:hypothetical protein